MALLCWHTDSVVEGEWQPRVLFLSIPAWARNRLRMFWCLNAGKLEICGGSYNMRLDILYRFSRYRNWQGLKKNHWQEVHFLYCYLPSHKTKSFLPKSCLISHGSGRYFLQSFSQLEFSPRDLLVLIVCLNLKSFSNWCFSYSLPAPEGFWFCVFRFTPLPPAKSQIPESKILSFWTSSSFT